MIVLRLIGTVLWFALPAALLTYAIHDLDVRDAPTYDIEGTVVAHRQVVHTSSGPDSTTYTTYFITVRDAENETFEFGDRHPELDTEPGTPVVVEVAKQSDEIVMVRKGGTVVDLRATISEDVWMIVFGGLGLLIALGRESLLEDYDIPRWAGFLLGFLAAGGGVYLTLRLAA
ncbi:hypothetical protein ACIRSS_24620 [Amycolatopsis sp. NPDC101161]|uniref:hypothetical protein n=1 Tax=Amycolatopsis sp. NPDC101161 TaxID=3363940 RepID=UPI0037FD56E5